MDPLDRAYLGFAKAINKGKDIKAAGVQRSKTLARLKRLQDGYPLSTGKTPVKPPPTLSKGTKSKRQVADINASVQKRIKSEREVQDQRKKRVHSPPANKRTPAPKKRKTK